MAVCGVRPQWETALEELVSPALSHAGFGRKGSHQKVLEEEGSLPIENKVWQGWKQGAGKSWHRNSGGWGMVGQWGASA